MRDRACRDRLRLDRKLRAQIAQANWSSELLQNAIRDSGVLRLHASHNNHATTLKNHFSGRFGLYTTHKSRR
ncbi:hypothetical protein CPB83DRAFT_622914 [Crepidotus variabilis]|uniref:Uncharacterized protein n=1 Tax=Crepidotus variabilis TaxID=179855 RepID=A0A9P6E8B5_9AGAR|nr:hypothetical protein CPB83DRAFT_622914 [Crepidotus variabilis]